MDVEVFMGGGQWMEMGGLSTVACSFNHSLGPQRNAHVKTERPGSLRAVKLPTRAKETIVLSSVFCFLTRNLCMHVYTLTVNDSHRRFSVLSRRRVLSIPDV